MPSISDRNIWQRIWAGWPALATIALAVLLVLVSPTPSPGGVSPSQNAQASSLIQSLLAQAQLGQLPGPSPVAGGVAQPEWQNQLIDAYTSGLEGPDAISQATDAAKQAIDALTKINNAEQDVNKAGGQNTSSTGDWVFGQVYPGVAYRAIYPLTNGCKAGQTVTFSYPSKAPSAGASYIPLNGPDDVGVNAYSSVSVLMSLEFPKIAPDPPGSPPRAPLCWPHKGDVTSVHAQVQQITSTQAGTTTYTCFGSQETYKIYLCLWDVPPPDQGGGPGPKKKPGPGRSSDSPTGAASNPCANLWNFGVFIPTQQVPIEQDCLAYIQEQAHVLFDQTLQPYRTANPLKWAWVPSGPAIDSLSVQQLLVIKDVIFAELKP